MYTVFLIAFGMIWGFSSPMSMKYILDEDEEKQGKYEELCGKSQNVVKFLAPAAAVVIWVINWLEKNW